MDDLQTFYALRVFADYLEAKEEWEFAHQSYTQCPLPERVVTRQALMLARDRMDAKLAISRATPEHKAAFGW